MAKEILIPQTSFVGESSPGGNVYYYDLGQVKISADVITVIFDGVKYSCEKIILEENCYSYGSEGVFTDYPFTIESEEDDAENWWTLVYVGDDNEHTIEAYVGEEGEQILYQHSNVRTQDNQIFYFDENTGDFIFFDGTSWGQNNDAWGKGIVPPKTKVAVVGTAIVGTDVVGESSSGTALVDSAIVDTDVVGEEEEVVLIPETTFTTNEQGSYNFVGVEAFKYSQIKIVLNGEEKIVDGTKPLETYVYIFSGSGPNDIGIATGTAMSKPVVSFFDSINQEPTTYTIKVIKITDEEIEDDDDPAPII